MVREGFFGPFPYDRPRIIYVRQGQYADAIRVWQACLDLLDRAYGQNKEGFRHHWEKDVIALVRMWLTKARRPWWLCTSYITIYGEVRTIKDFMTNWQRPMPYEFWNHFGVLSE
jgi:hypothetical protein